MTQIKNPRCKYDMSEWNKYTEMDFDFFTYELTTNMNLKNKNRYCCCFVFAAQVMSYSIYIENVGNFSSRNHTFWNCF